MSYLIFILASHSSSHIVPLCIHRLGRIRDIQLSSCSLSSLSFFPDPFRAAAAQPSMPPSKGSGSPIWGRVRRPRQRRQPQSPWARRGVTASALLHPHPHRCIYLCIYRMEVRALAPPPPPASSFTLHVTPFSFSTVNQAAHQHNTFISIRYRISIRPLPPFSISLSISAHAVVSPFFVWFCAVPCHASYHEDDPPPQLRALTV